MIAVAWFVGIFLWCLCGGAAMWLCLEYRINGNRWTWEELTWGDILFSLVMGVLFLVVVLGVWAFGARVFSEKAARHHELRSNYRNEKRF